MRPIQESPYAGKLFLSVVPGRSDTQLEPITVKHLRGTETATCLYFADALSCMGGLDAALPIFAQLDLPVKEAGSLVFRHNSNLSLNLLKLVIDLVSKSESCRATMRNHGGFGIVGYLFENLDPRHMTTDLIGALFKLEKEVSPYPELHRSAVRDLLTNFKLFMYADADVQVALFSRMKAALWNNAKFASVLRDDVGLKTLLDAFIFYFWFTPPDLEGDNWPKLAKIFLEKEKRHAITGGVMGRRPEGEELLRIRKELFGVIHAVFGLLKPPKEVRAIDATEVEILVYTLIKTPTSDDATSTSILQLFMRLLCNDRQQLSFVRHLRAVKGFQAVLTQLEHPTAGVRNHALAIVTQALHVYCIDPETVYPPRVTRTSSNAKTLAGFNIYVPPPTLMRSMSSRTDLGASGSVGGGGGGNDGVQTPTHNFYNPNVPPSHTGSGSDAGSSVSGNANSPTRNFRNYDIGSSLEQLSSSLK